MNEQEVLDVFNRFKVITEGHFVCRSGFHTNKYVNKDAIYPHTKATSELCRAIAEQFAPDGVQIVVGPAMGGAILSQWVAHHLSQINGKEVLSVYAEKIPGRDVFVIKRGQGRFIPENRVLVVEDVLNTGSSAFLTILAVREFGGNVIGVGALCNRGSRGDRTHEDLGVPKIVSLLKLKLDLWEARSCPLCARGIPVSMDLGAGRELPAY